MSSFIALDTPERINDLLNRLRLEKQELQTSLEYIEATSYCSGCPGTEDRANCCRENGEWEKAHREDYSYLDKLTRAVEALEALTNEASQS